MKKKILFTVMLMFSFISSTYIFAAQSANVEINGSPLQTDVSAIVEDGRTLVPMRAIFERLNAKIDWDGDKKIVTATRGDVTLKVEIGSNYIYKTGNEVLIVSVPAKIIDGRVMVPLRAVSEGLGCDVKWDDATKTAVITDKTMPVDSKGYAQRLASLIKRPDPIGDDLKQDREMYTFHKGGRNKFVEKYIAGYTKKNEVGIWKRLETDEAFNNFVKFGWDDCINVYLRDQRLLVSEEAKNELVEQTQLSYERNINAIVGKIDDDTHIGIIAIADDGDRKECAYIAILYDRSGGVRVYTLEYDPSADKYIPYYVTENKKNDYGVSMDRKSAETAEAFLEFVGSVDK